MSSGFGLDHLPYGVVDGHCVVRYEDHVLDLSTVPGLPPVFDYPTLNPFLALGRPVWEDVREKVTRVLEAGTVELQAIYELELPLAVGDYVDFYSSLEHATNVGRRFRPDDPLPPAWKALPIGYHGRAGSIVVSGSDIVRPHGLRPSYGPTEELDFELELGFVTGPGKHLGCPIPASDVRDHVFGFVLVNDWSARDLQRFEYRPLGPLTGKSFATSISAWVTPLAALEPYLVPAREQDPEPDEYLRTTGDWALDIDLEVEVSGTVVTRGNARSLYWTFPQQLAHATVNGAAVRPGDLFASGTISGPEPGTYGCLLEAGGPYLDDGDTVTLRGRAGTIELGAVRGTIVSAR
ncbi:fumarylacetoacetate hydrolase family protein [Solirubrobacter sp. CPCC 204708]|uniref:fumarylacetoacetase n=1 Tax=Solirubrobacter deserti TaxID=2282478 RepID=A0ABT4RLA7_9ACTN|nr:fumarylacetoacetate hydrolase family protein [Solirubrobacter deserti]MBE2318968.1 fumarylacetoacetate hydrolase family protein [Solirubrobacter deserti]MDA0139307.1 fumarylacetoacetate hydrolase family protein [Solirubrobacter deserti]